MLVCILAHKDTTHLLWKCAVPYVLGHINTVNYLFVMVKSSGWSEMMDSNRGHHVLYISWIEFCIISCIWLIASYLKPQAYLWPEEIETASIPSPMGGCSLHQVIQLPLFGGVPTCIPKAILLLRFSSLKSAICWDDYSVVRLAFVLIITGWVPLFCKLYLRVHKQSTPNDLSDKSVVPLRICSF